MYSEVEKAMARQKVSIEVRSAYGRAKTNILCAIGNLYKCLLLVFFFNIYLFQVLSYHATASNKEVERILVSVRIIL
jgi:hypothetical protein